MDDSFSTLNDFFIGPLLSNELIWSFHGVARLDSQSSRILWGSDNRFWPAAPEAPSNCKEKKSIQAAFKSESVRYCHLRVDVEN